MQTLNQQNGIQTISVPKKIVQLPSIDHSNFDLGLIEEAIAKAKAEGLLFQIIENRDWAENERYNLKPEVDESLIASKTISKEREEIENIFRDAKDVTEAVEIYLQRVNGVALQLKKFFDKILRSYVNNNLKTKEQAYNLWNEFLELADMDNAHAMYLSSGMWDFSVFNQVLGELESTTSKKHFFGLLKGASQDIRIRLHSLPVLFDKFGKKTPTTVSQFVDTLATDSVDASGVFLPFAYNFCMNMEKDKAEIVRKEYYQFVEETASEVEDKERFLHLVELYQRLNEARIEYDTFEYFGYYAFARHLLILVTHNLLKLEESQFAEEFKKQSSLYQYGELQENITMGAKNGFTTN